MHEGQGSEDQSPGRPGAWPPLPDGGDSSGPDQAPGPMTDGSMPDQQGWAAAAPAAPAAGPGSGPGSAASGGFGQAGYGQTAHGQTGYHQTGPGWPPPAGGQ